MAALAKVLIASAALASLTLPFSATDTAQSRIPPRFYGVNLASGEFAPEKLPGVHGQDYIYPTRATAEPFRALGMNSVRVPVLWERLQPDLSQPLSKAELERLDASLNDLSDFRQVILDVHNYGRHRGRPLQSSAALASLWTQLATRYKNRPNIAFGIMNEPHGISAADWRSIAEASVAAIRRTGANNLILVPGTNWSGGHSWQSGGRDSNAEALQGFVDPARNFVFEIHQYLDSDSSGTGRGCSGVRAGRERLEGATRWLRQQRAQAILGEFGVDQSDTCLAALDDLLDYLAENGDVWVGWNYWAGGDWWGDYPLSIQPADGREKPQAAILRRHVASYARR
jgi:endoglucanase